MIETIKKMWTEFNEAIDMCLPNVPNWVVWGILAYLILK